jgi:hypothetical protein
MVVISSYNASGRNLATAVHSVNTRRKKILAFNGVSVSFLDFGTAAFLLY